MAAGFADVTCTDVAPSAVAVMAARHPLELHAGLRAPPLRRAACPGRFVSAGCVFVSGSLRSAGYEQADCLALDRARWPDGGTDAIVDKAVLDSFMSSSPESGRERRVRASGAPLGQPAWSVCGSLAMHQSRLMAPHRHARCLGWMT